jgi:hypothetical protein
VQFKKGELMFKIKKIALAIALVLPMVASAETNEELKSEIDLLKAQVNELRAMIKQQAGAPAPAAEAPAPAATVDVSDFNQLQTKVDAMQDAASTAGMNGLRISGGIDPVYIYDKAKHTSSFAFLNNFTSVNGSGEVASYDNSYFGMAYLDIQKEMDDGGTRFRLTLAPSKSAGSGTNFGNIVHEATASVPLDGPATRLIVGQIADVSGYQPFVNTFVGNNALSSNLLYPGFAEYFITKNLLFDFAEATTYTGAGLDITRGPWETKLILANFNSARYDCTTGTCPSGPTGPTAGPAPGTGSNRSPAFIYNATYAQEEYWGYEFTGYEGNVSNLQTHGNSHLDQIEVDAWFTRADFNANIQYTLGRLKNAASNNGDAGWWGISSLVSERVTPKLTLAGRFDYLNDEKNGGGTFAVTGSDNINGFGPGGDPTAAGYDANKGANRYDLTLSATYRMTRYAELRGEVRHDVATTPAFYYYNDGSFHKSNDLVGLQTVVNF